MLATFSTRVLRIQAELTAEAPEFQSHSVAMRGQRLHVLPFRNRGAEKRQIPKLRRTKQGEKNRETPMEKQTSDGGEPEGGICRRVGEKGSKPQRAGERKKGKKKPAPEQKEKTGERHVQTREAREEEPAPACL